MATVLIADDEANLRKILRVLLERDGHKAITVSDGTAALCVIQKGGIDILITDLKMPGMSGLELLQAVRRVEAGLPILVITAHSTVDTAVSALKSGAFDYITKPFDKDELKLAVRKAAAVRHSHANRLQDTGDSQGRFQIIGQSQCMQAMYAMIEKVAPTPSTVLITGESGTGKELVASALHERSPRHNKPFIKVNCAAIPKDLMESEFFGYEQGAFTGAVGSKPGRFELADGGTLFLDEIAEIPNAMQVKLLRALQESEFERVGGIRTIRVDVRLMASTHRDLLADIAAGRFREDLYYRLNVVPMRLPALRERRDDIPLLAQHFIEKYNKRFHKQVQGILKEALDILSLHTWPGNIRELENIIERTLLFSESRQIGIDDLPKDLRLAVSNSTDLTRFKAPSSLPSPMPSKNPRDTWATRLKALWPTLDVGTFSMKDMLRQASNKIARDLIILALDETQNNVSDAAQLLKISRKGLQNKMKDLGLRDTDCGC